MPLVWRARLIWILAGLWVGLGGLYWLLNPAGAAVAAQGAAGGSGVSGASSVLEKPDHTLKSPHLGDPKTANERAAALAATAANHWAFKPVGDPPVPLTPDARGAAGDPIDAFIGVRLLSTGIGFSPPADRRSLIRRASFDLTGLPPSTEEVEAFERDEDPRAYETLIDRLLASPHYGEQWGRHWLDVARYSDTKGYVYGREQRFWVHAWVYRDWVVKALNDDMPYDRFLLLQIAADQVTPTPTPEAPALAAPEAPATSEAKANLAAMGFLTIGRRFLGVTHDIIDDRIDVVTRGTMGLTVSCARCHDHKYDPIPTQDYYSLYGVFLNSAERLVPIAPAAPVAKDKATEAFEKELAKRQKTLDETLAKRRAETAARVRARVGDYLAAQLELHKYPEEGFDQALSKEDILPSFVRRWQTWLAMAKDEKNPIFIHWHAYAALKAERFAAEAERITADLARLPAGEVHPLVAAQFAKAPQSMGEVARKYGELFARIEARWQAALKDAAGKKQPAPEALPDADEESLRLVLYGPAAPCQVPDEAMVNIETYFDLASCEELWRIQGQVDSWLIQSPLAGKYAVVLADRQPRIPARVFNRGRASSKGEEAPRRFLKLLSGANRAEFQQGSGRLELAKAIIDPANPLTARVMVNRVWMHHFGAGLVRTPSDFGTRAEPPSHPQLLDWLARRFMDEGWSLKKLHRRIMLSRTYQQASSVPVDSPRVVSAMQIDPENRMLWRMNERRLSFEQLRDALLAATGELDLQTGGKPADLFAASFTRRTIYGLVDRQFLPGTLRVFDFANPDLHIPQRGDTTVPQQALFFLNDQMMIQRAKKLAARAGANLPEGERVQRMYQLVFQRAATPQQVEAALAMVRAQEQDRAQPPRLAAAWQYGFGAFDEKTQRIANFTKLPHFNGTAWQGGPAWPDAKLGWVQLNATGGHAGNDLQHAAIRRWVAPRDMTVAIRSTLIHDAEPGHGVRGRLVSSRHGLLKAATVHNGKEEMNVQRVEVKAGDTLDITVDLAGSLNNNQFTWEVVIEPMAKENPRSIWRSSDDFHGPGPRGLDPWEQLAQVLFSTNEFMFIE